MKVMLLKNFNGKTYGLQDIVFSKTKAIRKAKVNRKFNIKTRLIKHNKNAIAATITGDKITGRRCWAIYRELR